MFKNKIYLGKVVHKDKTYEGQHEAIISQELWDKISESNLEDKYIAIGYPEAHTKTLAL